MHGLRLNQEAAPVVQSALPLLALNSVTMLGAEVLGRSYGGGILKMEPREAASLPVPGEAELVAAWTQLKERRSSLDAALRSGGWPGVVTQVDEVLLRGVLGLGPQAVSTLRAAATLLRVRRTRRTENDD
jgi:hypothetical protein